MFELKSTLSKILRNYELQPGGIVPKLIVQLTLKPQDGVFIGLKPRD